MKKTTIISIVGAAGTLALAMGAQAASFTDTNGHWALKTINAAISYGYVDGYPDGTFKPEQNVSRAEFIKLAVTALNIKTQSKPGQQWYEPFVESAVTNGIHRYEDYTSGDINTPITREEMARIAVRSAGEKNTDDLKWMYLATSKGIINGLDNQGTIGSDQPTTRAQAITVIERMLQLKAGEKLPSDKYATSAAEILWHKTNASTIAPEYFGWAIENNSPFEFDKLRFDAPNGYSETEKYIVVDMGDPTDPNRKLIPDNMRWMMKVGNERTYTQDVPTNAYAFLSFDHIYAELVKPEGGFQYSYLSLTNLYITGDNIGKDGQLLDVTPYAELVPEGLNFGRISLKAGVNDVRVVTGQIVPKMKGIDGNGFSVYHRPAQSLGEKGSPVVYSSVIKKALGGK
ncbi:S-layer homology domain-containing protein [Paenibacillus periandrae]|uniref:S-layer homology domain-containing protein n=1 Tax=Paenibacillus periandrae TaxID=1761741 RepID=UPI001F093707|nr:S-layer homology domain-containing protein [Paenibacillus periandrae]